MKRTILREFKDTASFWDHIKKEPDWGINPQGSKGRNFNWYGKTDSFDHALDLARFGWREGVDLVKPMAAKFDAKVGRVLDSLQPVYDVVGEAPDVGAFLCGEPEHMLRFEPREGLGRVVRFVVNVAASCGVDASALARRGAVVCSVVDGLERAGIRCEVVVGWGSSHEAFHLGLVTAKRADEPLNMDRLSFLLISSASYRRFAFRAFELESAKDRADLDVTQYGGYGYPTEIPQEHRGDIYLMCADYDNARWHTDKAAEAAALDMLRAAGVELTA